MTRSKQQTKRMVLISLFSAIEIVLALTPLGFIPLGFTRATTIHIPVILGAILLGPKAGMILGGVFGITSLLMNTFAPTPTSFVFSPFYSGGSLWSLVVVLVPRILIGVTAYYTYLLLSKLKRFKGKAIPAFIAGVVGSITNTILVMGGIYVFFGESYALAKEIPFRELFTVIMGIIGINGIPEAISAGIITSLVCLPLGKYLKTHNPKKNLSEELVADVAEETMQENE